MNLKEVVAKFDSELEFVKQLAVEVVKLGDENPDFIYNTSGRISGCHYNGPATLKTGNSSTPIQAGPDCSGCIFGQALQNMGWDHDYEMKSTKTISGLIYDFGKTSFDFDYLNRVQMRQDEGQSWGEAIILLKERNN